jgi:hypothetical protein
MRKEIHELLDQDPFRPFRITLAGGQAYEVRFPGLIGVGQDVIYFYHANSQLLSILRLVQVVTLDIIE